MNNDQTKMAFTKKRKNKGSFKLSMLMRELKASIDFKVLTHTLDNETSLKFILSNYFKHVSQFLFIVYCDSEPTHGLSLYSISLITRFHYLRSGFVITFEVSFRSLQG